MRARRDVLPHVQFLKEVKSLPVLPHPNPLPIPGEGAAYYVDDGVT